MKPEEGVSGPPELELQAVMNCLTCMLGSEFGSSGRTTHAFNC